MQRKCRSVYYKTNKPNAWLHSSTKEPEVVSPAKMEQQWQLVRCPLTRSDRLARCDDQIHHTSSAQATYYVVGNARQTPFNKTTTVAPDNIYLLGIAKNFNNRSNSGWRMGCNPKVLQRYTQYTLAVSAGNKLVTRPDLSTRTSLESRTSLWQIPPVCEKHPVFNRHEWCVIQGSWTPTQSAHQSPVATLGKRQTVACKTHTIELSTGDRPKATSVARISWQPTPLVVENLLALQQRPWWAASSSAACVSTRRMCHTYNSPSRCQHRHPKGQTHHQRSWRAASSKAAYVSTWRTHRYHTECQRWRRRVQNSQTPQRRSWRAASSKAMYVSTCRTHKYPARMPALTAKGLPKSMKPRIAS